MTTLLGIIFILVILFGYAGGSMKSKLSMVSAIIVFSLYPETLKSWVHTLDYSDRTLKIVDIVIQVLLAIGLDVLLKLGYKLVKSPKKDTTL